MPFGEAGSGSTTADMRRPPAGRGIPIEGLTTEEVKVFPMAEQQLNAPLSAPSPVPTSGVRHINRSHPDCFTVVGNHLAQHRKLSLIAIGLAVHIQSLPAGKTI